jgi:Tfp pilus assembly protein PilF
MHAVFPGLASWENADVARLTAARMGRVPTENEISRYWIREGLREIAEDPPRFAAGIARKAAYLLSSHEIANDRDLVAYRRENRVLSLPLLSFGVLLPLALVGFAFGGAGGRGTKLLVLYLACYGLSIVLFFVCARFRVPLLVALFPPAAQGLLALARGARRRSTRALAAPLVLLAASTAAVSADPFRIRAGAEGQEAFHRGNVEARLGNAPAAIDAYWAALEKAPRFAAARYHLGVVLLGEGREEEGLRELSLAMELDPRNPRIPVSLAVHLEGRGERARAEEMYRRAVASDPYFAEAQLGLGALLAEEGRLREAEPLLRRALELSPGDPAALLNLGKLLGSTGRGEEAEEVLRRLTESGSGGGDAWFEYGGLLARRGRFSEAAAAFREAIRLDARPVASYMNLSLVLREAGDRAGAAAALREALALDPGNEVARRRLEDVGP